MRNISIDITCKTTKNLLEFYAKLKDIEFIYNLVLYKTIDINVLLGWASIPMLNEATKKELEANFGSILKITDKSPVMVSVQARELSQRKNLIFKSTLFQVTFKLVVAKYLLLTKGK